MKRNFKYLFRIAIISILVFSLSACSDSDAPTIQMDGTLVYTIGDDAISYDGVFTATDEEDGDVTASIMIDDESVDYTAAGAYKIHITAEDAAGNKVESSFDVTVKNENVAPVIIGMENVSIHQGEDTFDFSTGVTASDNLDGDLTASIVVDDSGVDYVTTGIYRVTFSVSDAAGNEAEESINVTVTNETVAPVLEGLEDVSIGLDTDLPDFLEGITANDNLDGDITNLIVISHDMIDTSVLGMYTITYTVKDAALNETVGTIEFSVVDMTAPVIDGTRDLSFKVFDDPDFLWKTITVMDNIDGDLLSQITIDDSLVNTEVLGDYDLTYIATDAAGNVATTTVTISIKDYEKPSFTVNDTIYYIDGDATPDYLDYIIALDNYDGDVSTSVIFDDSSVDLNTSGTYDISMTITDSSGNTHTDTLVLIVPTALAVSNINADIDAFVISTSPLDVNLVLPSVGINGTTIMWNSLNDGHMTDAGKLIPSGIGEADELVTLVGTYNYEGYIIVVEYDLIVASKTEATINSKLSHDYFGLGEEWVTVDSTLDAYYELNSVIPYIDVEDLLHAVDGAVYYDEFVFTYEAPILTVSYDLESEDDDGVITIETLSAQFNFDENTVTSGNTDFFGNFMTSSTGSAAAFEGLSFEGVQIEGHEVTYDLGLYGFDMVVYDDMGTNKFLIPFNILQTLLFGPRYFDVYFNGDAFYGTEYQQLTNSSGAAMQTMQTSSANSSIASRELKMATYNYLAFTLDHYYGIKDVVGIETYYNELEPFIVDMIFSNDLDYYQSIFDFVYYLDDPHTYYYSTGYYQPEEFNFTLSFSDYGDRTAAQAQSGGSYDNYYESKYGDTVPTTYILEDGITAIIHVPTMHDDTMPDQVEAAMEALPAGIVNVVLDVALNGGGWNSVTYQILGMMTNETFADHSMNPFDGSVSSYYITSDFDAYTQYNWFVLTAPPSYSASTSFAAMAKEVGIPVIGLPSGGGASSVQIVQPFGGSIFVISSNNVNSIKVFNDVTGEFEYHSIEFGVEVDYELSDFLNDEALAAAIAAILAEEEEAVTE